MCQPSPDGDASLSGRTRPCAVWPTERTDASGPALARAVIVDAAQRDRERPPDGGSRLGPPA